MLLPPDFRSQTLFAVLIVFFAAGALEAGSTAAAPRILVVDKASQELAVFVDGRVAARYPVSFGVDPVSDKRRIHDLATPEGLYFITYRKDRTRFFRTLGLSYPSIADAQRGLAEGIVNEAGYRKVLRAARKALPAPCDTGLGCAIAIHGGGVYRGNGGSPVRDWTEGCIALDNGDMLELFNLCRPGDPVLVFNSDRNLFALIRPFTQNDRLDDAGLPVCPDGVCTYGATLRTWLGTARLTVREGREVSLEVVVSGEEGTVLALTDRNADGEISFLDSVGGTMADLSSPESAYGLVRSAVIVALSSGELPVAGTEGALAVSGRLD